MLIQLWTLFVEESKQRKDRNYDSERLCGSNEP